MTIEVTAPMRAYYGTKRVEARPATKLHFNPSTGVNEDRKGYEVRYPDGYVSWSPKAAFEAAYRPETAMGFEGAIAALKEGRRVARAGWNGKGMWIAMTPGSVIGVEMAGYGAAQIAARHQDAGTYITIGAHIDMRAADGTLVIGWLASQTDMLAEDWTVVE